MNKLIIIALTIVSPLRVMAQLFNPADYEYQIERTDEKIIIDGKLDEASWSEGSNISRLWEHYPIDSIPAAKPTMVKVMYDDEHIYVGAWCTEESPEPVIQNLVRDDMDKFWSSDGFSFVIDPTNSDQTGYFFGMNAAGAKQDAVVSQQGLQPIIDRYWNSAWQGDISMDEDGYYFEFAIPFSSMKFDKDIADWGYNFIRNDSKRGAYYLWTKMPIRFVGINFLYNGTAKLAQGVPDTKRKRLELKSSVSASLTDNSGDMVAWEFEPKAGLDAKFAINEKLNMDAAILPDYSTVEVDQQFIDFYRFEVKVPEQREFFLENNDLFAAPGSDEDNSIIPWDAYRIKPFYTRRIGIRDWNHVPILYGCRVSGKVADNSRVSLLNMQVRKNDGDAAQNYTAIGTRQTLGERASVSMLLLNRQTVDVVSHSDAPAENSYNRNAGLQVDLSNKGKNFKATHMFYRSINPESKAQANMYGAEYDAIVSKIRSKTMLYRIEDNYIAEMGFTPRLFNDDFVNDTTYRIGYSEVSNYTKFTSYSGGSLRDFTLRSRINTYLSNDYKELNEWRYNLTLYLESEHRDNISLSANLNSFDMKFATDVLKNETPLPAGRYETNTLSLQLRTSTLRKVQLTQYTEYGSFYNGTQLFMENAIAFRAQPWGVFSLKYNMFQFDLPEFGQSDTYHLAGFRSDINFNRNVSWVTLVQYNTQKDNVNINSLFKWRFKPLSDVFLVVKNNSDMDFEPKDFQIVGKVTFWFNPI